ncbi:hypothetical protein HY989_03440 [Candidatus Micrarchaeota archaeon]|nr:hypothetical protein [Candidatus Micrarchaeota archaeon]
MATFTVWLEIVRVLLGTLLLLAISTLYQSFKDTKIVKELNIIMLGFGLYTLQAILSAYRAFTGVTLPIIWKLQLDDFFEACMYVVFALAIVRFNEIFSKSDFQNKVVKAMREVFG